MDDILNNFYTKIISLFNSDYRFLIFASNGLCNSMDDEKFLKRKFKAKVGYALNLENPQSFNEKLQWLKLYNHNPLYTTMVDKYAAKDYVANIIGKEYIIPTLGVWGKFGDINFNLLPDQFVLKCTHDSGGLAIIKDKKKMNKLKVKKKIEKSLKRDYFIIGREWPYKNVPRRIIAEQYMSDESGMEPIDYKFMCFNGVVRCSFVCSERYSDDGMKVTFFDRDWNVMQFERHYPKSKKNISKPENYNLMISLSEKLSKGIPFVRVDFYEISGRVYFGELTFFPGSGMEEFTPESADYELGSWIKIPELLNN